MFEHMFMPLDRHFDDGFGAIGEAFKSSADRLVETQTEGGLRYMHGHLPINFLYRHAIELFLKSSAMVLHRRLRLPSGDGPHEREPRILIGGKWKPITTVHGIADLYRHFKATVQDQKAEIAKLTRGEWMPSTELDQWIATIEAHDPASTCFRYPVSRDPLIDQKKSSFKPTTLEEIVEQNRSTSPGKFFLLVDDGSDTVVDAFALDHEPLPEVREALVKAGELLAGASIGLYAELVTGAAAPCPRSDAADS